MGHNFLIFVCGIMTSQQGSIYSRKHFAKRVRIAANALIDASGYFSAILRYAPINVVPVVTISSTSRISLGFPNPPTTPMESYCSFRVGRSIERCADRIDFTRLRHGTTTLPNPRLTRASASIFGIYRVQCLVESLLGAGTNIVSLEKNPGNRLLSAHHFATNSAIEAVPAG